MQPLLSIQIPYTEDRREEMNRLYKEFERQAELYKLNSGEIEIYVDGRGREISIGQKRSDMYQQANGLYVVQWDSDDWISEDGLKKIVDAIVYEIAYSGDVNYKLVDCITYEEYVHINGVNYSSRHSVEYSDWEGTGSEMLYDGFNFHRTPFMKDVIKTSIAKSVPVPDMRFGEDHEFSKLIKPLLKTEHHIPEEIYHYIYISNQTFEERYGLNT